MNMDFLNKVVKAAPDHVILDMHEAILNVASNITPPDQTLWQKIKSVFTPKPILK